MLDRVRRTWPAVLVATLLAVLVSPTAAQSAPTRCPGTFQVLHNDHIGRLSLPAGPYVIDVIDSSRLSCAGASDLFRQFLEDFDGRLPRPWVLNGSSRTFTRGSGSTTGFQVTRSSGGGGGGGGRHPATGLACPSFFHVLHNDHIGRLRLPAGEYRITLLSLNRISCAQASRYFAQFLQDFDGRLPRPWVLDVETGSFMRGSRNVGFRVKPTRRPAQPERGRRAQPAEGPAALPGDLPGPAPRPDRTAEAAGRPLSDHFALERTLLPLGVEALQPVPRQPEWTPPPSLGAERQHGHVQEGSWQPDGLPGQTGPGGLTG